MKRKLFALCKCLVVVALFIAIMVASFRQLPDQSPASAKRKMKEFLSLKQTHLGPALADAHGRLVTSESADTGTLSLLFKDSPLRMLDSREAPIDGHAAFMFDDSYSIGEGEVVLRYLPADKFILEDYIDYLEEWHPVSSQNSWRWEGGGAGGEGYIKVERLQPCWFYVEAYLPT